MRESLYRCDRSFWTRAFVPGSGFDAKPATICSYAHSQSRGFLAAGIMLIKLHQPYLPIELG